VSQDTEHSPEKLYLELLTKCLTWIAFSERCAPIKQPKTLPRKLAWVVAQKLLSPLELEIVRRKEFDFRLREEGLDWLGDD